MIFERVNVLNQCGASRRCLLNTTKLLDLLVTNLRYKKAAFYVVDQDKKYLGTITENTLADIPADMLSSNPAVGELLLSSPLLSSPLLSSPHIVYECDEAANMDVYVQPILKVFNANPNISELPVTTRDKKLIAIIDKTKLIHIVCSIQHDPNIPINAWSFTKNRQVYSGNLNACAKNIHTQHGEDGILERLFSLIGRETRYAVEFGGWDGVYLSNIRNLIVNHGYSGLYIEGDHQKSLTCRGNYADNGKVACVEGYVGFLKLKKLDDFLQENNAPGEFDLLSIDIDGYDYHVWDSLQRFQPRVVIIEYNPSIPNDVLFINPYSEDIFMGSSASAMVMLANKKGYELVAVTTTNCIFVKEDEYHKTGIAENSLDVLRFEDHLSDGRYYQAYDKTLYYKGFPSFIWSGEALSSPTFKL